MGQLLVGIDGRFPVIVLSGIPRGTVAAAYVEEMRPGYDQLMIPVIDNIPVLILVYLITIPLAILAIRLTTK